jgi:sialate O-acetylesterase
VDIVTGLFDRIVLQRTNQNLSDARITGRCETAGTLEARVTRRGQAVRGFNWSAIGQARGRKFEARLRGLPVGGPYDVGLRVRGKSGDGDELTVRDVLVGDVWLLGGQSNMQGCGLQKFRLPGKPMVRAFYMTDEWDTAVDPIHNLWEAIDPVHGGSPTNPPNKVTGVGPGVAFGQELYKLTGVPQGLIACAHGGTSMSQWDPSQKSLGGGSLYGASIRRLIKNGGRIAGIAWYQGESDANTDAAPLYTQRMKTLIRSFRRDAGDAKLPFVLVQISRVVSMGFPAASWNSVQDQQRTLQDEVSHVATVPAIDLMFDDGIHIGAQGCHRLGKRLAQAMATLKWGRKFGKPPIRLRGVEIGHDRVHGWTEVIATFDNVEGQLRSGDRPAGFAITDSSGAGAYVFDTRIDGNRAIARTLMVPTALADKHLMYGFGTDPYCNVTDEADRAVPVFGPVPLTEPAAYTPFLTRANVSELLPGAGKLHGVKYPRNLKQLAWRPLDANNRFLDRHLETTKLAPQDNLFLLRCELDCSEPMKLAACLGYDGPVKLWIDGKEKFHDPEGTNPAWEDRAKAPFNASRGKHEVVVAFGTNNSRGWGIFLRFQRVDVTKKQLAKGSSAYVMPTVK